ncbi:MAG: twitching motility protein PilT, partial [Gammaproteobacteria bacterium]|nr:twitching motility protein PilT [Gammaproteobacteria bacterium]
RCTECNGQLRIADDSDVLDKLSFAMLSTFDDFWKCEVCDHIHWKGSHYLQLATLLETL